MIHLKDVTKVYQTNGVVALDKVSPDIVRGGRFKSGGTAVASNVSTTSANRRALNMSHDSLEAGA